LRKENSKYGFGCFVKYKMLQKIIEWFKNLDDTNKIAIVIPVGLAAIGGLFVLFKWLFSKKDGPSPQSIKINTGIDPNNLVDLFGKTKEELGQANERIRHLEEQLAKTRIEKSISSEQSTPTPSTEAKELAKLITENDGPYAQALKAIAEGNNKKADGLLDETQKIIDHIQQRKNEAQAKIYMARMQNAFYTGRPQDALQYCDKLRPLADNDPLILNKMAVVYHENVMYQKAEPLIRRALEIDEKSFGTEHPNVARDLNNLAALLQNTNRLKEAEPLMRRALQIDEQSFGPNHPDVARDLNNLAQLLKATNQLKEAEPIMRRVVNILENPGGDLLPNYAGALNNLAELLRGTGRYKEAEPLYRRALEIDEKLFGSDHPNIAIRLNNMALLLHDTNRLKEAEPLIRRAIEIDEKSFGKDHPDIARDLNNLAALLEVTNRKDESRKLYERAVKIFENSLGPDHPKTITARQNLASLG
jgi:tetratricopeptide (TPR) repeat protein